MESLEQRYNEKFSSSKEWFDRGRTLFAGGITHQTRFTSPFPPYFQRAEGAFKYDVDGNEIIDYVMGNGSLLMGHSPAEVTAAVLKDFYGVFCSDPMRASGGYSQLQGKIYTPSTGNSHNASGTRRRRFVLSRGEQCWEIVTHCGRVQRPDMPSLSYQGAMDSWGPYSY